MAAMVETLQRHYLPVLAIGLCTGLLALIPKVGWILGFSAFLLAYRYARRHNFVADVMITLALWLLVQHLFLPLR
jgi:hypothetical protein